MQTLQNIVGAQNMITAPDALRAHLTDWRGRFVGQAMAMLLPESPHQIAAIIHYCRLHKISITAQGGNTSLAGAATPLASGQNIILNLSRMNKIDPIDAANQSVLVQAGVILQDLQKAAQQSGLLFPLALTPQDKVQIGGALATNAGGLNVLKYGMMRHLTLGIEVVLGTGEIYSQLRPLRKNNFGYAMPELLIGSEGTLGIITSAQLRLFPKPMAQTVLWAGLPDFASCIALYQNAQKISGGNLSACEYMNRKSLQWVEQFSPHLHEPFALNHAHYILIQADGTDSAIIREQLQKAANALPESADYILADAPTEMEKLWALRKSIPLAERAQGISIKHDLSLPLGAWGEFMEMAAQKLSQKWPDMPIIAMGHLGDGNLHYNLAPAQMNASNYDSLATDINRMVFDWVIARNGSPVAEHGVGILRRPELQRYSPPAMQSIWRNIKNICDPDGILNPGKVV